MSKMGRFKMSHSSPTLLQRPSKARNTKRWVVTRGSIKLPARWTCTHSLKKKKRQYSSPPSTAAAIQPANGKGALALAARECVRATFIGPRIRSRHIQTRVRFTASKVQSGLFCARAGGSAWQSQKYWKCNSVRKKEKSRSNEKSGSFLLWRCDRRDRGRNRIP